MRTNPFKRLIACGLLVGGAAGVCSAQQTIGEVSGQGAIVISIGQGGSMRLPQFVPEPRSYALTGETTQRQQTARAWQRELGPIYSVGQARIILPSSR